MDWLWIMGVVVQHIQKASVWKARKEGKKHEDRILNHPHCKIPVMVHLVENEDMMTNFLPAEEAMHMGYKSQQLLKSFSKGNQHCQAMWSP